jgi:hypothetical protein
MGKTKKYCLQCDVTKTTQESFLAVNQTSPYGAFYHTVHLSLNKRKRWAVLDLWNESRKNCYERYPHCFFRKWPYCYGGVIHPKRKKNRPKFLFSAKTFSCLLTENDMQDFFSEKDIRNFPLINYKTPVHFHPQSELDDVDKIHCKKCSELPVPIGFTFFFHYDSHTFSSNSAKACDFNMGIQKDHADFCPVTRGLFYCSCATVHEKKVGPRDPNSVKVTMLNSDKNGKLFCCGKSRQKAKNRKRKQRNKAKIVADHITM